MDQAKLSGPVWLLTEPFKSLWRLQCKCGSQRGALLGHNLQQVARIEHSEIRGPPRPYGNIAPGFRWRSIRTTLEEALSRGYRLVAAIVVEAALGLATEPAGLDIFDE